MMGCIDVVKFLTVEKHCHPICRDFKKNTPLHMAAGNGHTKVVKFLTLQMHCDVMCRDSMGNTPLHMAAGNGHIEVV